MLSTHTVKENNAALRQVLSEHGQLPLASTVHRDVKPRLEYGLWGATSPRQYCRGFYWTHSCSKQGTTCLSYRCSLPISLKTHHATVLQLRAGKSLVPKVAGALCWQQSGGFTAACAVTEATQSLGPNTPLTLLGCIPSSTNWYWGSPWESKRQRKVVKHAALKISQKLMGICLLAAGPCHGLDLHLNSYIFFPLSFSWIHLAVCKHNVIREKNTAKQPNASQRHATSPALEPQSHLFNNNNSTYLHSCQGHVTSAWEKTSQLRVYFWQKILQGN